MATLTPAQLREIALTLTNDSAFHKEYTALRATDTDFDRRQLICRHILGDPHLGDRLISKAGDRDQLRRYFDRNWEITGYRLSDDAHSSSTRRAPTIEFWLDEVRNPPKAAPSDLTYTHPNAAGMLYRKGADGYVEYRPALGGTWADCARQHNAELDNGMYDLCSTTRTIETTKDNTMNSIAITTKTLVNGQDIAGLSDSQVYDMIAQQEAEIAKLSAIVNKPQRLVAEIDKRQAGISALVAHLDSKDAPAAVVTTVPA